MRLTAILLRFKKKPPGGHMWTGKHRLYKEVKPIHLATLRREYELEERNMFYLRHPYLTIEQSRGHAQALNHRKEWLNKMNSLRLNWRDNEYLGDRLGYLKVDEKWD